MTREMMMALPALSSDLFVAAAIEPPTLRRGLIEESGLALPEPPAQSFRDALKQAGSHDDSTAADPSRSLVERGETSADDRSSKAVDDVAAQPAQDDPPNEDGLAVPQDASVQAAVADPQRTPRSANAAAEQKEPTAGIDSASRTAGLSIDDGGSSNRSSQHGELAPPPIHLHAGTLIASGPNERDANQASAGGLEASNSTPPTVTGGGESRAKPPSKAESNVTPAAPHSDARTAVAVGTRFTQVVTEPAVAERALSRLGRAAVRARQGFDHRVSSPPDTGPAASTDRPSVPAAQMKPEGSPAAARAAQVDEAVRLQNAMVHAAERAAFGDASASGSTVSAADRPAVDARAAQVVPALTPGTSLMAALGAERVLTAEQGLMPDGADDASTTRPVVRGLAALINQRGGGMSMRLDPPELGELRIQMTISRGAVTAEFHARTAQAHGLLERNLATLRHALESQGLTVDRLSVHAHVAPPGAAGQHMLRDDSQGQQSAFGDWRSRDHDAAGSESRGRREHQFSQHHGHRPRSIEFDRLFNAQDFGR